MTAPVRSMPLNDEILLRTPAGRFGLPEELAGTGGVSGVAGFGLCYWHYDSGGWRICDSVTSDVSVATSARTGVSALHER